MKILHVNLEKSWGGGEKQLMQLIEESEPEHFVVCLRQSMLEEYCLKYHIQHRAIQFSSPYFPDSTIQLIAIVNHYNPDIIHLHTSKSHTLGVIANWFIKLPPLVVTRRMNNPVKLNSFSRHKYNHPAIKKFICVSEAVKTSLLPVVPAHKLETVYGGIRLNNTSLDRNFLKTTYPVLEDKKVIGFVGSLTDVKDPLLFIETAELLLKNNPELMFIMIGDGAMNEIVIEELEKRNLTEAFILAGFIQESFAAISGLDLLLVTSKNEGIPNVILEAFLAKIPVVSVNIGGIPELIEDGKTGLLTQRIASDLTEKAQKIIDDTYYAQKLLEAASEKVKKFSHTKGVKKTIRIYQELLKQQ